MSYDFTPVEHLVQHAVLYLESSGYAYSSVKRYHKCWKKLLEVCQREDFRHFCYEQCFLLMLTEWKINLHDSISHFQRFQIRSLKCLRDFQNRGMFSKCYRNEKIPAALFDSEMLLEYEKHLKEDGLRSSTMFLKS